MRDPRSYQPQRLPGFWDLIAQPEDAPPLAAAPAMVEAAAPEPTLGSRLAGLASGIGGAITAPVRALGAPLRAVGQAYDTEMEARRLRNQATVLANARASQEAQLAAAQFPAQAAQAQAQAREQAAISARLDSEKDPRAREGLLRGAATGTFQPFELEPGPAELAAYQNVLGMQQEEARQRLIGQREMQQARLTAGLQQETNRQELAGRLAIAQAGKLPDIGDVRQLRQEFEGLPPVKNFTEVRQAYKIIRDLPATKAGDLTLLVKYMKLIDPSSSVREGELATADKAGGVPAWLISQYNTLRSSEGRLAPTIREDFVKRADDLYQSYLTTHRGLEDAYRGLATRAGIKPEDVVTDFVGKDDTPKAPRKTFNGHEYEKVDGGWKLVE